jgi:nicotinic acid phosphoribosyltransferase
MNKTYNTLTALALAGFISGISTDIAQADMGTVVKGATGHSTIMAGDKESCGGKDGCGDKDGCEGTDKEACGGKDGCGGK